MSGPSFSRWTRRKLLQTAPAACGSLLIPRALGGEPLPPSAPFSKFVDVAKSAGLTETMVYGNPGKATYITEIMGGGCAFIDYDNDGWMDLLVLGGRMLENVPPGSGNRLYHNNRDGTFTDVTEKAGLGGSGWATGVCVGDYNNDGFEDLYITYYGQNRLYHNNGDGTFADVTKKAGLEDAAVRFGTGCAFVDYNRDGLLDLFVANYADVNLATAPKPSLDMPNCNYLGIPVNCGPSGLPFPRHSLYRNNGDGTFTDISKESGIAKLTGTYGLTALAYDVDGDGWPDILVACDSTPSLLLINKHNGTFQDEALERGIALSGEGQEMAGMGAAAGDYDLDGQLDVVKTHFMKQATGLYHNTGRGEFEDVTTSAGLISERRFVSWGVGLVDLDNDGYPDIFQVTGTIYPELEPIYPNETRRGPRLIFRNLRDGRFAELSAEEAGPDVSSRHVSRGCAFGDFDNDGDLDIVIMNQHEPPSLLRNDAPAENRWLKIKLQGTKSNRSGIGSRVVVRYGAKRQAQVLLSQSSYLSCNDPRLHFGLGPEKVADVEVTWPLGTIDRVHGVGTNQILTIREGQGGS